MPVPDAMSEVADRLSKAGILVTAFTLAGKAAIRITVGDGADTDAVLSALQTAPSG